MGTGTGMRAKDLRAFCMVARQYNVYILVRHTNDASLGYIGQPGYYPKPATIKAKTADVDPPPLSYKVGGAPRTVQHHTIHIYAKTGLQSRAGAALWAVEQGLYR